MRKILAIIVCLLTVVTVNAQFERADNMDGTSGASSFGGANRNGASRDTTSHKQIPRGLSVWTIDPITGDRTDAEPDTTSYLRMNHVFASGVYGEYNTLGNNGTMRLNRIFTDRVADHDHMMYDGMTQILKRPEEHHFTNTYSPITNLDYNECGDLLNGEDHLKATYAVNVNKRLGLGFKFDYLYARGYYANQSTSHLNFTFWGSYLGERYQSHLLFTTNHQKMSENGGITNDDYIKHPELFTEKFSESEIPTVLTSNWNKHDNHHFLYTQRYSVGFNRRVPMTEKEREARKFALEAQKEKEAREAKEKEEKGESTPQPSGRNSKGKVADKPAGRPAGAKIAGDEPVDGKAPADTTRISMTEQEAKEALAAEKAKSEEEDFMKDEYVPVTSFFHTLDWNHYRRTYLAYESPEGLYKHDYYELPNDTINDRLRHTHLRNYLGVSMLEGFNKWMKAGVRLYAAHEMKNFTYIYIDDRDASWTANNFLVGGGISKRQGKTLHFDVSGEFVPVGNDIGQVHIDGALDLNIPLLGDTVRLDANGFFHLDNPLDMYTGYLSRHFIWDTTEDFSKQTHTHIEGNLSYPKTDTRFRFAVDNLTNYAYLAASYRIDTLANYARKDLTIEPRQTSSVQVITAQLFQNLSRGILHWDNVITFQKSTDQLVLPVPTWNIYSTLYLRFKIAKVLATDFGVDMRYFSEYEAPEYAPQVQSFVIQENDAVRMKVGNYPICNVYANFQLKNCRFFIMMSHVNCSGKGNYFLTPHHPLNGRTLRFGLNWNFFN